MSISLTIKEIARSKNLSLKSLSFKIGLSEAGFHKMLKSDNFWINDLVKISEVLNVPLAKLLSLTIDDIFPLAPDKYILLDKIESLEKTIIQLEDQLEDKKKLIHLSDAHIMNFADNFDGSINAIPDEKLKEELRSLLFGMLSNLTIDAYQKGLVKRYNSKKT